MSAVKRQAAARCFSEGLAYQQAGLLREARAAYERGLALDPEQIEAERRGDGQRPPELATRLSGFEVMNEAHADAGRQRQARLRQAELLAGSAQRSAELLR